MASPSDVAAWMLGEVQRDDVLYQDDAAYRIQATFGDNHVYVNDNGNLAIGKPVLKKFKILSGETVVWERGDRLWRNRTAHDASGRQQD